MNTLRIFLFLCLISLPLIPLLSVVAWRIAKKQNTEVNINDIKSDGMHDKPVMKINPYKLISTVFIVIFIVIFISMPDQIIEMVEFLVSLF